MVVWKANSLSRRFFNWTSDPLCHSPNTSSTWKNHRCRQEKEERKTTEAEDHQYIDSSEYSRSCSLPQDHCKLQKYSFFLLTLFETQKLPRIMQEVQEVGCFDSSSSSKEDCSFNSSWCSLFRTWCSMQWSRQEKELGRWPVFRSLSLVYQHSDICGWWGRFIVYNKKPSKEILQYTILWVIIVQ